jgi:hypothetical protein
MEVGLPVADGVLKNESTWIEMKRRGDMSAEP